MDLPPSDRRLRRVPGAAGPTTANTAARVSSPPGIGLGDAVARLTRTAGVRPCGGCQRRAEALNRLGRLPPRPRPRTRSELTIRLCASVALGAIALAGRAWARPSSGTRVG
jgi:hypothetical protein